MLLVLMFSAIAGSVVSTTHVAAHRVTADTMYTMNDGYIFGLRNMVDQEEIETARLAIGRASNPKVVSFARLLLHGHSSAQNSASALGKRLGITLRIPADSDSAIVHRHRAEVARLTKLHGTAFDRVFLTYVRDDHIATIARVNTWYLPAASNDSVKAYLHSIMPTLESHEKTAAQLLLEMPKAPGE